MYRAIPSANKILSNKWQSKDHDLHKANLARIKGTVDTREPREFQHLKKKYKKTQQLEERYTEIERENRILLEKMTNILQKQRKEVYTANAATIGDRIQGQRSHISNNGQMMLAPLHTAGGKRSLNRDARKRELTKITRENQLILKRLQDKSANYNVQRWQRNEEDRTKVLKRICEYPLIEKEGYYNQPDFIIKKKNKSASVGNAFYKKTRGYTSGNNQMQLSYQQNQIIKKETLYNGEHDLGNGFYRIEMLISQTDDLVISAQHIELPDSFVIEIESSKVGHLINEFQNDFVLMAQHLKIMNKRMVLLNPKFVNKEEAARDSLEGQPAEQLQADEGQQPTSQQFGPAPGLQFENQIAEQQETEPMENEQNQQAVQQPGQQREEEPERQEENEEYTEAGASQVPLPAPEHPAVEQAPAEDPVEQIGLQEQPTGSAPELQNSNSVPAAAASAESIPQVAASAQIDTVKKQSSQQIQEADDKEVEQSPSPVAADPPGPATIEQEKANKIEHMDARQSQEELARTKKAEGEKSITVEKEQSIQVQL